MGRNSVDNSLKRYEEMLKIMVRYNDYLERPRFKIGLSSPGKSKINDASIYISNVKNTLNNIDKEMRYIIENEFFSSKFNSFWWVKHYSRATYYRKRNSAVKAFIESFQQ